MGLRKWLYFDLGTLFRRAKAGEEAPEHGWDDLWFVVLFTWIGMRGAARKPMAPLTRLPQLPHKPGLYYRNCLRRIRRGRWTGPVYWSSRHWREDLCRVLSELTSIVRTNGPVPEGLGQVAREERRQLGVLSMRRWISIVHAILWITISTAFALLFTQAIQTLVKSVLLWHVPQRDSEDYALMIALVAGLIPGAVGAWHLLFSLGRREAVYLALRDYLWNGMQLSEAMERMPRFFPPLYADLVRAGEDSGSLLQSLEQLDEETLDLISMRAYVRTQFLYLGFVFVTQVCIGAFILVKVVPVFAEILRDFSAELPVSVRLLLGVGDFIVYRWPWLLCLLAIPIGVLVRRLFPRGQKMFTGRLSGVVSLIPGVHTLVVRHNSAAIALILSKLLAAGAPLPDALRSAARSDISTGYRRLLGRVIARVEQGENMAAALAPEERLLPKSFRSMTALGEHSGMLPEALSNLAANYRRGLERFNRILADMLTPAGIAVLGFINLFIEVALFTSITGITDSILNGM